MIATDDATPETANAETLVHLADALQHATPAQIKLLDDRLASIAGRIRELQDQAKHIRRIRNAAAVTAGLRENPAERFTRETPTEPPTKNEELRETTQAGELSVTEAYRLRARDFLRTNGPASRAHVGKACNIPTGSLSHVLSPPHFITTARGVELPPAR